MADEFTEALCRAKKEAVYQRPLSDEEWQKMRETSTHPLDQWIVLAVARVALERASEVARVAVEEAEKDYEETFGEGERGSLGTAREIEAAIRSLFPGDPTHVA